MQFRLKIQTIDASGRSSPIVDWGNYNSFSICCAAAAKLRGADLWGGDAEWNWLIIGHVASSLHSAFMLLGTKITATIYGQFENHSNSVPGQSSGP